MARTSIENLSSEQRAILSFIGTMQDGSAFSELAYQSGRTLRDPKPFGELAPDVAYLIARTKYYGATRAVCGVADAFDPDTHEPLYRTYQTETDTYVRNWFKVMLAFPYTATPYSSVTWTKVIRAVPGGMYTPGDGTSCSAELDEDGREPPNGWNREDLGDPPAGFEFSFSDEAVDVEFSNDIALASLTTAAEGAEELIYAPPTGHVYWDQICAFNYRQGLADFLFLGGIDSIASLGVARRHKTELKIVGSRIPCTLHWEDTTTCLYPAGVPSTTRERQISFGPGNWSTTLDDGYPPESYRVGRGFGRIIPAGG